MNPVSCASLTMPLQYSQPSATAKFIKPDSQRNRTEHLVGIFFISCSRKSYGPCPWRPTLSNSVKSPSILLYEGKRALTHIKVYSLKSPKGFGPVPKKKKMKKQRNEIEYESEEDEEIEESSDVIPEVVTNRMMNRIGIFVGAPLAIGISFFPLFYYMKVVLKWNVPDWLPFITSFFTFGSAALGISYGIVSSSWDPLREGSLLGWIEAQKNWPVFWQSVWKKPGKR